MSLDRKLHVLKCFMTSIRRQSSEDLTFSFAETLPVTVGVVRHCIRHQCFILLPNVQVVFKILYILPYFIIINIVARNNVQHCIKHTHTHTQKKVLRFCTTSGQSCYTSRSFALSTWPHGRAVVICARCVVIFLKTIKLLKGIMFDIN